MYGIIYEFTAHTLSQTNLLQLQCCPPVKQQQQSPVQHPLPVEQHATALVPSVQHAPRQQLPAPAAHLRCFSNAHCLKTFSLSHRSRRSLCQCSDGSPSYPVSPPALQHGAVLSSSAEAADLTSDAAELHDSSQEALESVLKLFCGATLIAGVAFELFGVQQCWSAARGAMLDPQHIDAQQQQQQPSRNHAAEGIVSVPTMPPAQALGQHALGRAGIWALLLLALLRGALSWLTGSRCDTELVYQR